MDSEGQRARGQAGGRSAVGDVGVESDGDKELDAAANVVIQGENGSAGEE